MMGLKTIRHGGTQIRVLTKEPRIFFSCIQTANYNTIKQRKPNQIFIPDPMKSQ